MTDTKQTIICPACGKQMKKIFIEEAGINVDICSDGCGGIFFDNQELENFDEIHENADKIFQELAEKHLKPVDGNQQRICPVCNVPMLKMEAKNNITIDVCNVCGAKFLDDCELHMLRGYFSNNKNFFKNL